MVVTRFIVPIRVSVSPLMLLLKSDSKLKFGKLSKSKHDLRNRSTILRPELQLFIRKKSEHDLAKSEHDFARRIKTKRIFMGLIWFQVMRDAFHYKYKP